MTIYYHGELGMAFNRHLFLAGGAVALIGGALSATSARAAAASCPTDDAGLSLPSGFCATVFADGIGHARHLVAAANGVLYVNTWSGVYFGNDKPHAGGFLVALKDTSGSGHADVNERFGETAENGGHGGTGIGLFNGFLFAETNDKIIKYKLGGEDIVPSGTPQTVVEGLPLGGDHPMHPFAIDPAGNLFVDVASATNSCQAKNRELESAGIDPCVEQETRGGVWRYSAAQTHQAFSAAARYATGIRNAEGYAIDTAGHRVFVTQHGRDQLHSNWPKVIKDPNSEATLPSEELMLLTKGADFGWPKCYFDPYADKLVLAPEYGGDGKRAGLCAEKRAPVAAYPRTGRRMAWYSAIRRPSPRITAMACSSPFMAPGIALLTPNPDTTWCSSRCRATRHPRAARFSLTDLPGRCARRRRRRIGLRAWRWARTVRCM